MVKAEQIYGPQQLTTVPAPGQVTVAPGVLPAQDIGTLLTSIMPLITLMMVIMMVMPMMKGLAEAFKAS